MNKPNSNYGTLVQTAVPSKADSKNFPRGHGWRPVIFEYDARGIGATRYHGPVYSTPDAAWDDLNTRCAMYGIWDVRDGGHIKAPPEYDIG